MTYLTIVLGMNVNRCLTFYQFLNGQLASISHCIWKKYMKRFDKMKTLASSRLEEHSAAQREITANNS